MIKPNWDIFKAKFSENPQDNFEWFCYLLFCREFKKEKGIFRFKNQSAIETNPIEQDGEVIGWQAKFYETSLSTNKGELVKFVKKAKRDYPSITKLLIYTNKEWAQTKGKVPKGLIEVENTAKKLEIKLKWNTTSFFESEFVSLNNENISKHFFSQDSSIFDQIEMQQLHSENILAEIKTSMNFDGNNIEIDRKNIINGLENVLHQIVILSGVGGVGKTATIKKLFNKYKDKTPFYIFKATEFELRNINDLLIDFSFQKFVDTHQNESNKYIVIDSAEKLLNLNNTDPFKEFLRIVINNNWRLIFTTRDDYLEVLNTDFTEIYDILPANLKILNLNDKELTSISEQYGFSLPNDEKLINLIKNPFYLNQYLRFYAKGDEIDYVSFKESLWNKIIKKATPAREQCFFNIALERANKGRFFINPKSENLILSDELKADGVLGYETPHGYYITHDIYEEWALEKIIESKYIKSESDKDFFSNLGQSLPIRRSFRNWVSEKLLVENNSIKDFIEDVFKKSEVKVFWKDEIIISVLLSDHSECFFEVCKEELLRNKQEILKRLTFLARIACKEVDADVFATAGVKSANLFNLTYVLTKPKGRGWESLIKFVYENLDHIGISNIYFILPIIYDWNSKNKSGNTVRKASLIALKYYDWMIKEDNFYSRDETIKQLLNTIIYGSLEIKPELESICTQVVKNKWKKHRDPYYSLSKVILSKLEGIQTSIVLPNCVLRLADLFWFSPPKKDVYYSYSSPSVHKYYHISETLYDYYPASAYQTPIYWLLQSSLNETINFIIEFTNKTVEAYALSDLDKGQVEEISVYFENCKTKQYISNRLWCTYRGTQVSPHILESMHMALEKFFLDLGEKVNTATLEGWLLYLLKNSRSASISAVVASIVLAFPNKTFNVAKVLFKTKEFYSYDTVRWQMDQTHKVSLSNLKNMFGGNYKNENYEAERLRACDDKHRQVALEHLFLNYQMFRSKEICEEEATKRQVFLWKILDEYYNQIPELSKQNDLDKTWRLYLARMDRRKMAPTTEEVDGGIAIQFNPEIEPELMKYSESTLQKSTELLKYMNLKMWSNLKLENNQGYKKFEEYERNPRFALEEVKKIISKFSGEESLTNKSVSYSEIKATIFMNASIPGIVCSVLFIYHFEILTEEERVFCKNIILDVASVSLMPGYEYQMGDGSQAAISVLPTLFELFPEDRENIKTILLFTLFDDFPVDMGHSAFSAFPVSAIQSLWNLRFEDAQSLLFGYLILKPKYEEFQKDLRRKYIEKDEYGRSANREFEKFISENEQAVFDVVNNTVTPFDLDGAEELDLRVLNTALQMIPLKTNNLEHKVLVKAITLRFVEMLLSRDKDESSNYTVKHDFLRKYAFFILSSPEEEIEDYLKPFLDGFTNSEGIADLFTEIISAEDYLCANINFWVIWGLFKDKVIEMCGKGDQVWYTDKVIRSYLFAQNPWKETTIEWHTLQKDNKRFFKEMSQKTGHCPSTLYAISKLLNDIGSSYLNDGLFWLSYMLKNYLNLSEVKLVTNTIYHIENLARKYIYNNREEIRRNNRSKKEVLVILSFLIEKGSVVGYMLRERIL